MKSDDEFVALESALKRQMGIRGRICLLFDRFDALFGMDDFYTIASNLRALRDDFKYSLTFVTATRRPLDADTEIAELFFRTPDLAWSTIEGRRILERTA